MRNPFGLMRSSMGPPCIRAMLALSICICTFGADAHALTAPDLSSRVIIDGLTADFTPDESIFGSNTDGSAQESDSDSQWGPMADINQIRITWDRAALYFAADGVIWEGCLVVVLDIFAGQGVQRMDSLNSWSRNVQFAPADFRPDVLGCTWDTNTAPRLLLHIPAGTSWVNDLTPGSLFQSSATFEREATGRAMEFRVPWTTLFTYCGGVVARDTVIDNVEDTLYFLPAGSVLRIAGFVTSCGNGTGGPDVAPNNTTGCSYDAGQPLIMDNYAMIELDADGDGLPDMNASPSARVVLHETATSVERSTWGQLKLRYHDPEPDGSN